MPLAFIFSGLSYAEEQSANRLESIDFRVDGELNGKIIVQLATPSIAVDIQKAQEGLSIELMDTSVSDDKLHLLDVHLQVLW